MEKFIVNNLEELRLLAEKFVKEYLSKARKVLLYAPMGAGKTTFVKMIAEILGVEGATSSPTFALLHTYPIQNSDLEIAHADLYRLKSTEEAFDIGMEELFYDNNYLFVEWPELIEPLLPETGVIYLRIQVEDDTKRIFEIEIS